MLSQRNRAQNKTNFTSLAEIFKRMSLLHAKWSHRAFSYSLGIYSVDIIIFILQTWNLRLGDIQLFQDHLCCEVKSERKIQDTWPGGIHKQGGLILLESANFANNGDAQMVTWAQQGLLKPPCRLIYESLTIPTTSAVLWFKDFTILAKNSL